MTARYQHDDIARIAYWSWLERGQPQGSPEVDWYYALSVVTNPEEIRATPIDGSASSDDFGNESHTSSSMTDSSQSMDGFGAHAVQGVDGESMQDDAEQTDRRAGSPDEQQAADTSLQTSKASSRSSARSGRRAGDKSGAGKHN